VGRSLKEHEVEIVMLKKVFILILIGLGLHIAILLNDSNLFVKVIDKPLTCHNISGVQGPEDLELFKSGFIISSGYYAPMFEPGKHRGELFYFEKNKPLKILTQNLPFYFNPHGIETWNDEYIFAINHKKNKDTIEVFRSNQNKLDHIRTIDSDSLYNANDIAAISANSFFISHDHGARSHLGKMVEDFSRIGRGFISFYHDGKIRIVANSIIFANGLALDRLNKILYVASMTAKKILKYKYTDNGNLTQLGSIELDVFPDNLTWDKKENALWVGAHVKILDLKTHSEVGSASLSPSQILRIDVEGNVKVIFSNKGDIISGSSVALPIGEDLYIGSIFLNKLVKCQLNTKSLSD